MFSSRSSFQLAALGLSVLCLTACGKKGKVHFANLQDGAQVESPFTVKMTAENLVVEPAANGVTEGHGHFHILVDVPVAMSNDPVPNDGQHIHYGQGQTEAVLDLPEGDHTLILQFAKGDHRPYEPQITEEIHVRVTKRNVPASDGAGAVGADSTNDSINRSADPRNVPVGGGTSGGPGTGM